jgi:hypothetical protein
MPSDYPLRPRDDDIADPTNSPSAPSNAVLGRFGSPL